jgi:hypothetical protein
MKLLHLGHEEMFALHRSVDNLIEAVGGGAGVLSGGVAGRKLGFRRSLGNRSLDEQGRGAADEGERKEYESGGQHFCLFHFTYDAS